MQLDWQLKEFDELSIYELQRIMMARQAVFFEEQGCAVTDADEYDELSLHYVGKNNLGEIVTYARILAPSIKFTEASFGRLLVARENRSLGLGKELVRRLVDICEVRFPEQDIRIGAQCYLVDFYAQHGFTITGEPYFEGDIEHVSMLRSL